MVLCGLWIGRHAKVRWVPWGSSGTDTPECKQWIGHQHHHASTLSTNRSKAVSCNTPLIIVGVADDIKHYLASDAGYADCAALDDSSGFINVSNRFIVSIKASSVR